MKNKIIKALIYIFLVFLLILCIIPFYLVIINSTYNSIEIVTKIKFTPGSYLLNNYRKLQELTNIWRGFLNSLLIAVPYVVLTCYFGSFTAYGIAKYKFKGRTFFFSLVIASMMIPSQLVVIGFYKLNLKLGIFNKIVFPCITPGVATIGIFNFVSCWNNYLSPLIILSDSKKFTMPILISTIKGVFLSNYGAMYVAIAISVIPVIIIYAFLSKYIINGLTMGAVK